MISADQAQGHCAGPSFDFQLTHQLFHISAKRREHIPAKPGRMDSLFLMHPLQRTVGTAHHDVLFCLRSLYAGDTVQDAVAPVAVIMEKQRAAAAAEAAAEAAENGEKAEPAAEAAEEAIPEVEKKPEVTIDDFARCQFQIGEIIACEAVKKSKKLLCSQVKIGSEVRQIVSGIRKYYSPEEMVGRKVMVITNLKPAKLAGLMSEGMILCAEAPDGSLALMTPEAGKDIPAGSEIG